MPKLQDATWRDVISSAVILYGPHDTRSYDYPEFLAAVQAALQSQAKVSEFDFVVSLGPLAKNNEWYLGVSSPECRDELVKCGVLDVNGRRFKIRSTDDTRFNARIHWSPPYVPASAIIAALGDQCKVESMGYEMCKSKGFEKVSTGIRTVSMVGDRHRVPHLITVTNPINSQKYELLVTVAGRAPLCLKCRLTGHYRRECNTPYCRHHGAFGHSTESCVLQKVSYANAAKKTVVEGMADKPEVQEAAPANNKEAPMPARRSRQQQQHTVGEDVNNVDSAKDKEVMLTDQMRQVLNDMSAPEVKAWINAGDGIRKEMEKNPEFLLKLRSTETAGDQMAAAPAPARREVRDAPLIADPSDAGSSVASARPAGEGVAVSPPATETTKESDVEMKVASSVALSPSLPAVIVCHSDSSEASMSEDDREGSDTGDWEQITNRKRKGNPRNDSPRRSSDDSTTGRLMIDETRQRHPTRRPSIGRTPVGKPLKKKVTRLPAKKRC